MFTRKSRIASIVLVAGLPTAAYAQQTFPNWVGPANGSWSVAGNWNPFGVPNNSGPTTYAPIIPGGGSPVLNISVTVDKFGIGPGAAIQMNNNVSMTVLAQTDGVGTTGLLSNEGTFAMNSVGNITDLIISGGVGSYAVHGNLIGTTALITMSDTLANRIYGATSNEKLIFGAETLLEGAGQIGLNQLELENFGDLRAMGSNGLIFDPGVAGMTNHATMQAVTGPMTLSLGTFRNVGGLAVIRAQNTRVVTLSSARVEGGYLETFGSGVINSFGATVSNVNLLGTLAIPNNTNCRVESSLTFAGASGLITMQSVGNPTDLIITSPVTTFDGFGGSAGISMSNTLANRIYGEPGDRRMVLTDSAFIRGAGQIGFNLMSLTVGPGCDITAIGSNGIIIDPNPDGMINNGLLRGSNGSSLVLSLGECDNTNGEMRADVGGNVSLSSATVVGGLFTSFGSGNFVTAASVIEGVTSNAVINLNNNNASTIRTFLVNNATLAMNSVGNLTDLTISGNTTISGPGVLTMTNTTANRIYASNSVDRLTNAAGHTIRGSGQLGLNLMALTNNGQIESLGSNGLTIDPNGGGVDNNATLRSRSGSHMTLANGTFDNLTGVVAVEDSATCALSGATVLGGVFTTAGSGLFTATGSIMENVTSNAKIILSNNTSTTLRTSFINNNVFNMNSVGNITDLFISGNTTLTGPGVIAMTNTTANRIYAANSLDRLTNASGHTIRGSGQLGVNLMALTNNGLIEAQGSNGLTIDPNAGGVDNNGILRSRNGSNLVLSSGTFDNTGALIDAENGALCTFSSATVIGGQITSAGTGSITAVGSVMENVTSVATVNLPNNNSTSLRGTYHNFGTFNMNSVGNATDLFISGNTTLADTGVLNMSNTTANRIYDPTGVNRLTNGTGHTIRGAGQIGVNLMSLTNIGTIEASASNGISIDPNASGFDNQGSLRVTGGTMTIGSGPFTTSGTVTVNAGLLLNRSADSWVQTGGTVTANGELQVVANIYDLQGGFLSGTGLVDSNVTNSGGFVSPGTSPGTLTIEGNYVQLSGGTLKIEITGVTDGSQNDLLAIQGTGSLNGTIAITRPTGFIPALGQGFTILTTSANGRSGTFSAIDSSDFWHVVYLHNAAVIVFDGLGAPDCPADFDGDGALDFFDYDAFVVCYEGGFCPPGKTGDFDGDGGVDFFDYDAYVAAFEAGCN